MILTESSPSKTSHIFAGTTKVAERSDGLLFTISDHLGTSSKRIDSKEDIVSSFTNLPFGEKLDKTGENNYLYTGKELDYSGLYYYGTRFYQADIGKFTSRDPILQQNNYRYAENNPLRFNDPDGKLSRETYKEYVKNQMAPLVKHAYQTFVDTGKYPEPEDNYLMVVMPMECNYDCADFAMITLRLSKKVAGENQPSFYANNQRQRGSKDDILQNVGAINLLEKKNTHTINPNEADTGDMLVVQNSETYGYHTAVFAKKPYVDDGGYTHYALMYDLGADPKLGMKYVEFSDKKTSFLKKIYNKITHKTNDEYYIDFFFTNSKTTTYHQRWNEFKK